MSKSVNQTSGTEKVYARILNLISKMCVVYSSSQRTRLGDVAVFENRQPVTEAKLINKS